MEEVWGVSGGGVVKVIIAGPRDLSVSNDIISKAIRISGFEVSEIVHGLAEGVDTCAKRWARDYGYRNTGFQAEWSRLGKSAGPARNRQMARYGDALIVIKRRGRWTSGTQSMLMQARNAGLPTYVQEVAS